MYKNNTVNIQNGTPDTEYIDEFLSSFFFFPPGGLEWGVSVHGSYIHGHAWLSDRGVSVGAEGRGSSRDPPSGGSLPYRGAEGLGWGFPLRGREDK